MKMIIVSLVNVFLFLAALRYCGLEISSVWGHPKEMLFCGLFAAFTAAVVSQILRAIKF